MAKAKMGKPLSFAAKRANRGTLARARLGLPPIPRVKFGKGGVTPAPKGSAR